MFPKTGRTFPGNKTSDETKATYAAVVAMVLETQLGASHQAIKTVMRWTGAGERTVKNWFSGTHGPSGENLIALARHSDAVLEVFLSLAGRQSVIAGIKLLHIRSKLQQTVEFIDIALANRLGGVDEAVSDCPTSPVA